MTRNFSNRRRDDMRPTSRTSSSGRYREEQSSRTSRPRLSRDAVDRAWENGATRKYADYRARPTAPTSRNPRQERPSPRFERSRPPYEQRYERRTDERRPYEHRQEDYRTPSSFQRSAPPREQRPEEGPRRFNTSGHRAPENQSRLNSERWTRPTPPRRESEPGQRRYEDERPPRFSRSAPDSSERTGSRTYHPRDHAFERTGQRRLNERAGQGPRDFARPDREQERFAHGRRTPSHYPQRDVYNPRWQSRPAARRDAQRYASPHEQPPFRQQLPYAQPEARNSRVTTSTSHWMTSQCGLREPLNRTSPACQMDGCSKVLDRHSAKQLASGQRWRTRRKRCFHIPRYPQSKRSHRLLPQRRKDQRPGRHSPANKRLARPGR